MGKSLENVPELIVVVAALVLVLASFSLEGSAAKRGRVSASFVLLGLLSAACFINFGAFRGRGVTVHEHEQFHFWLGSKYLPELRYDAIYEAVILASGEASQLRGGDLRYRDPLTFAWKTLPISPQREAEIRGRFTPRRWLAFQQDARRLWKPKYLDDHGNTGSPAWAMTAGLFTRFLPLTSKTQAWLGFLDLALLALLFAAVGLTLGPRVAGLAMVCSFTVPLVFTYLNGSILRMDWLVALGVSVCLFEKRQFRTAGVFLGYAVASKLLAAVMVLPLGLRIAVETVRRRRPDPDQLRYVVFALGGLALFVLLSAAFFGDFALWPDYARRMLATLHEKYYMRNHSLRDLFLQVYHMPGGAWHPLPDRLAAVQPSVFIGQVRGAFLVTQLTLLGGLVFVACRNPPRFALALGPLAVFLLLVSNRYYWQMWLISAIALVPAYRKEWRSMALLVAILAWIGSMQFVSLTLLDVPRGGYFGSYGLLLICAGLMIAELYTWIRQSRTEPVGSAPDPD